MAPLKQTVRESFQDFRHRLAFHDALPQLVSLGVLAGIVASLLIVGFRWLIETPLLIAFAGQVDGFESLSPMNRFLLPFIGAVLIGAGLTVVAPGNRAVSVTHVLERLHKHQGKMPAKNIVVQFLGGMVALISGQSVGREGPAIHLGAGVASQLGQYFRLPNNSLRTLIACGAAAGISASFNTPMAGVIFAMEVILMEYTITGFIPVIIASVLGATITQLVFGAELNFNMVSDGANVLWQLPYLVLAGAMVSLAAALFIRLHLTFFDMQRYNVMLRLSFVGLVTGTLAIFVPEIMGTGYDTLNGAMAGELGVQLLLAIFAAKLLATSVATGMGMLGGLIGPTLMIGGCLGALLGILGNTLVPGASGPDFYVILGMVAMMGAVLNAPLAALVAILELSHNPVIIFPSMLTVVVACLGVRQLFGYEGVFAEQLKRQGHDFWSDPGHGFLSRVGVRSVMNRSLARCQAQLNDQQARDLVTQNNLWLVFPGDDGQQLVATAELARRLDDPDPAEETAPQADHNLNELVRLPVATLDSLASLQEASTTIRENGAEALLIVDTGFAGNDQVVGVVTRTTISNYLGM